MTQSLIISTSINKRENDMPRLDLTQSEFNIMKQALETFNDMNNDMALDDLPVNLYVRGDSTVTLNATNSKLLRDALSEKLTVQGNIRSLLTKAGIKVNDRGYSI